VDAIKAILGTIYYKITREVNRGKGYFFLVLGFTQSCFQGLSLDRGNEVESLFDRVIYLKD